MNISLLIIIGVVILVFWLLVKFKLPKCGAFNFISGGVKSGKSSLTLALALKYYRKSRFIALFYNHFLKYFDWHNVYWLNVEMPLFYSNIPVKREYVPLTLDLLVRKTRFRYGSIIFLDEASLFADSKLIDDKEINQRLLLFNKLIGHELGPGGKIFINSQSIADCHYSIKRCMSNYIYVHNCWKIPLLPLFVFRVRELFYSDDNTSLVNVADKDLEDSLKTIIVSSKFSKMFDRYVYSTFTDNLKVEENIVFPRSLKSKSIISFRDYSKFLGGDSNESHEENVA